MQGNLAKSLELYAETEGGFVDSPSDPGGATNHGITLKTLTAWRLQAGKGRPTVGDVVELSQEEADEILQVQYLTPVQFDKLPWGLDYAVGDFAINSGPSRAVKTLQEVLGFTGVDEVDGLVGLHTLQAIGLRSSMVLLDNYCTARLEFMKTLANWEPNAKGWQARVARVHHDADVMMNGVSELPKPALVPSLAKAIGRVRVLATTSGRAAVASAAGAVIAAGSAAPQAISFLQGYQTIRVVHWLLVVLGAAVAFSPLAVVIQRNAKGATT